MHARDPRLPPLADSQLDPEAKELLERTRQEGRVLNIFRTLAHHPKLLKRWTVFGNHILYKTTLPARDREILILRTAWLRGAEYEWGQHVRIGKRSGLGEQEIELIAAGPTAAGLAACDRLLIKAADELVTDSCLADDTWNELAARYSPQQILDLCFTVGQYTMLAMALNSVGVRLDEGVSGFPATRRG
jgi:alkylhydroperoxidase family enzyme